jgi:carbohydrate kinase (thermoresistant glucokinase family)/Cof subfamily protein (haloacid dehalogenase superfamily)
MGAPGDRWAMTERTLFVSDIDGTAVTPDKTLTPASLEAAAELKAASVPFTVVSSRPPRGMARVVEAFGVSLPFAAFNGGSIIGADMQLIEAHRLAADAAQRTLAILSERRIDAFVFADDQWLLKDASGPHQTRERHTVGFDPVVVASFDAFVDRIDKLVAVSDDPNELDACEAALRAALGGEANVERSQTYYVDVTHPLANKGAAVRRLAALTGAELSRTVVIGDMTNDVAMFRVAGFSIAMGQAPPAVQAAAKAVTASNAEDGWAKAVRGLVLPRLTAAVNGAPTVLVTMGVSGAGKTTLGEALAKRLAWPFIDGDALHPPANVAKMKSGQPLTDADRAPWLKAIGDWIDARAAAGEPGVISCSALRRAYRDEIDGGRPQVRFVYIHGDFKLIAERMAARKGHFMPTDLLQSQYDTLEPPAPDEPVITVEAAAGTEAQVDAVAAVLKAQ